MKKNIPFSIPTVVGTEKKFITRLLKNKKISGGGNFSKLCNELIIKKYNTKYSILTTSCTHALELSAKICDIKEGDEVIIPSFTFCATANAFINCGATIKYLDIKTDDMNINEKLIEGAITDKTKAIVVVHYAGVACEMDYIMRIAKKHNIYVVEDAAQAIGAKYKGKWLGSIGDIGCYSFHDTKNLTMGEGGAILINNEKLIEKAIIISNNGTDRRKFLEGLSEKYLWVSKGASFVASDLNAAFLYSQLLNETNITKKRLKCWENYYNLLKPLENKGYLELQKINKFYKHNGHIFYLKLKNHDEAKKMMEFLKKNNISTAYHYTALQNTPAGKKYGSFVGVDKVSSIDSERLLRLPMYYKLKKHEIKYIVNKIYEFFEVYDA